ncbi:DDE-type integrase/transposase/recombinase [Brevibacterium picturae]
MKSDGEIMEILEAYDSTGSYRAAAELAGCSHHTVKAHVVARGQGRPVGTPVPRDRVTDEFMDKITELVIRSGGKIRADKVHERLVMLGYQGSERSTRRGVAEAKQIQERAGRRVHRPWIAEPGLWLQYDYGDGPVVAGAKTVLFIAWVAFSRFRVVIPLRDKTLASVFMVLDRTFRLIGGIPAYVLTDNEKTVTTMHVAGVPVRNRDTVSFAKYYGTTVLTCQPADPASKGGVERSVQIAKADLVPMATNLLDAYDSFADLETACQEFMAVVNGKEHRVTKRRPIDLVDQELEGMHPVPDRAHTIAFGLSRKVPVNTPMVAFESGQYSVPHTLMGCEVFVRVQGLADGEQIVIVAPGADGVREVARHGRARPGTPAIDDSHFPTDATRKVPGVYAIRAKNRDEEAFLAIGHGAHEWLREAAAAGASRMRQKMVEAVVLSRLHGREDVDQALGTAAAYGRFATGDVASLLAHRVSDQPGRSAGENASLAQGTAGWQAIGTDPVDGTGRGGVA